MKDKAIYELIERKPELEWLRPLLENHIVIIPPKLDKYKNDENIVPFNKDREISKTLLIDLLKYDDSYELLTRVFDDELWGFSVYFMDQDGKYINQFSFHSKPSIIENYKVINFDEYPSLKERFNKLVNKTTLEALLSKYDIYNIEIEGNNYQINVKDIIELLTLNEEEYMETINKPYLKNIPTPYFLYAANKFFNDNRINQFYIIDDNINYRLEMISISKYVDIESINIFNNTKDTVITHFKLNEELEHEILNGIPDTFNDLEKALYIYIKMCKTLTYDEEYYAVNQKGPVALKHKNVDILNNISLTNNKVVCYEFDSIYAYLLHKLGIKYSHYVSTQNGLGDIDEEPFDEEYNSYSEGHTFLKFKYGKFIVKADSVTTILHGDIMQAKLNQGLAGLKCNNKNEETQKEFKEIFNKVYKYVANNEPKITSNEAGTKESFEDLVKQFEDTTDQIKPISFVDKTNIMLTKLKNSKLKGIDAFSYLLQLRKVLFTPVEQKDFIISIIRNNEIIDGIYKPSALAILSIRIQNPEGKNTIIRQAYSPNTGFRKITRDELEKRLTNGELEYIDEKDHNIPGIKR